MTKTARLFQMIVVASLLSSMMATGQDLEELLDEREQEEKDVRSIPGASIPGIGDETVSGRIRLPQGEEVERLRISQDLEIDPDGARSLSGGSKSQIDIPHQAALRFFGVSPEEHFSEEIELNYDSLTEWKKADFRGDLGLNHQLRLNLITQHKGGPNYENTVLVMEILSRNPTRIRYNVFPLGGPEHEELLILSERHEELHETFGKTSRQWGFF